MCSSFLSDDHLCQAFYIQKMTPDINLKHKYPHVFIPTQDSLAALIAEKHELSHLGDNL